MLFRSVHARYPDGRKALDGFTLELPAGKTVALVGPSGAGKSSALSVLLGFLPLESGVLRWDERALTSGEIHAARARLGWVPQEPVLFTGSVAENLRLADAGADEEALWEVLSAAHAAEFVRALPGGLEAQVGERGARLSGGQRQRLAIARAMLARPSVLLLDEPTSALDAQSEAAVQAGLEALRSGRTALLVAHRLATADRADLVAVVDAGRVVEVGPPAALRAAGGRYARLWAAGQGPDSDQAKPSATSVDEVPLRTAGG